MTKTLYILNGPNLNLLGTREPEKYGRATLADVEKLCRTTAKAHGFDIVFRQSNIEGDIVNWIQDAKKKDAAGIVLNAAGYTTTSVAILDSLLAVKIPSIEVHITNIHAREEFRHNSLISKAATGLICGLGIDGYVYAIAALAKLAANGKTAKTKSGSAKKTSSKKTSSKKTSSKKTSSKKTKSKKTKRK